MDSFCECRYTRDIHKYNNKFKICSCPQQINELEKKLCSITEAEYNSMFAYYHQVKHLFELEGMTKQIIKEMNL